MLALHVVNPGFDPWHCIMPVLPVQVPCAKTEVIPDGRARRNNKALLGVSLPPNNNKTKQTKHNIWLQPWVFLWVRQKDVEQAGRMSGEVDFYILQNPKRCCWLERCYNHKNTGPLLWLTHRKESTSDCLETITWKNDKYHISFWVSIAFVCYFTHSGLRMFSLLAGFCCCRWWTQRSKKSPSTGQGIRFKKKKIKAAVSY